MTEIVTFFCYCDDAGPDPTMKDNDVRSIYENNNFEGTRTNVKVKTHI